MNYPKIKPATLLKLRDMAQTLEYGSLPSDRRIQVVMPAEVVTALDQTFSEKDRSHILTQLALEAILNHQRYVDRPDLGQLADDSQSQLNTLWNYLEERDNDH